MGDIRGDLEVLRARRAVVLDAMLAAGQTLQMLRALPDTPDRRAARAEWRLIHEACSREDGRLGRRIRSLELAATVEGGHRPRRAVSRLAQANGWGSAGQCPGTHGPKTPAVREQVSHVVAAGRTPASSACGTAHGSREVVA